MREQHSRILFEMKRVYIWTDTVTAPQTARVFVLYLTYTHHIYIVFRFRVKENWIFLDSTRFSYTHTRNPHTLTVNVLPLDGT